MRVREVHARAVLAPIATTAREVRTMTAPVGLAIRALVARLMMDRLARLIQDQAGRATAVLVAPVTPDRVERGKTVRPFAANNRRARLGEGEY